MQLAVDAWPPFVSTITLANAYTILDLCWNASGMKGSYRDSKASSCASCDILARYIYADRLSIMKLSSSSDLLLLFQEHDYLFLFVADR